MSAQYDFIIEQFATFSRNFSVKDKVTGAPIDLTAGSALMQIRDASDVVVVELSTANGRIILGNGSIDLLLSAADTAALNFTKEKHDLTVTFGSPAKTVRFFQGTAKLSAGVSHV